MAENENENAEIIENELPGKFEDVKVLARLPELKGNKSLYEAFKSEATISHYDCIDFPDAIEHFGNKVALKAMKNELKTNAQDTKRRELQAELRKKLAVVLGDPSIASKLGI